MENTVSIYERENRAIARADGKKRRFVLVTESSLVIRTMTEDEVELAIDWAAKEGWNPGLHDGRCFWAADPQGFFIALEDGQPVGCVSAVRYGSDYAFLGFYVIKPSSRGKGYGLQLCKTALDHVKGRVSGIDGVLAMQDKYSEPLAGDFWTGFQFAYSNIRFRGSYENRLDVKARGCHPEISIVSAAVVDQTGLCDYDGSMFFAKRPEFLAQWLNQPESAALAAVQNGKLTGYGVIRRCREGHKIGPLFADNGDAAEELFFHLAACANGEEVFLDVPEVNGAAMTLAAKYNMTKVFETARMYNGPAPNLPLHKIFGVTSFELG